MFEMKSDGGRVRENIIAKNIYTKNIFQKNIFAKNIFKNVLKNIVKKNIVEKNIFKKNSPTIFSKKYLCQIFFHTKKVGAKPPLLPAGPRLISSDSEISA